MVLKTLVAGLALAVLSTGSAMAAGDAAAGEKVFKKCKACHTTDAKHRVGPGLGGVVGRVCGSTDFPRYSDGIKACNAKGAKWDAAKLKAYIPNASKHLEETHGAKGKGMTPQKVSGADLDNLVAYLETLK